ncbi:1-deoxy-D-xylulose-5-phosphate synthase [Solidesulfovibrio carbinolicus]|uniref:1-deoxy-D-xylulose-5-phosphate synthase n=1 Tax=Solidesulfovibrio carbinolicus TaxID=296842 RepID=A0A4V0YQT4_9BACT|nr:1-deoxy-D-xylulose-5-phosphate synthase [Solidesulfovibrio carbinolicus]QAZ67412.1 1-deoxy-D-xylulose-5-phosphate synthase [Solidesulfovibrio carbinolicus]
MTAMSDAALRILTRIKHPHDVAGLSAEERAVLAEEIRQVIIGTVSMNGGHLAPSLGVVELTLALLAAFDPGRDKFVWDVGHQAYAYKILTGRQEEFHTLRTMGGVSGFPRPAESPFDHFGVGHSSTSISAALGLAMARDRKGENHDVIAVIGDGSMTAGLAYEGLNQAGGWGGRLIVVLNDNEMSISKNVGALSLFLSRKLNQRWVKRLKKDMESWIGSLPYGGDLMGYVRRGEESFKSFFTPGMLFEAFRFNYLGPIDGHNTERLIEVFKEVKDIEGPVLVHVLTKKGRGYEPAESNPTYFHGVGCFEPETGLVEKAGVCPPSYTQVFGEALLAAAKADKRVMAITAAMPEGTGVSRFATELPDQFVDVGICEQHAVTFAAGLAMAGFRPVVAIYSTFLQRSYDQIVHDVCLQDLPVTFCLDRAGLVGEDGATHHGAFDISYLRHIPNLVCMAPGNEAELPAMLATALAHPGAAAIRYPRGAGVGLPVPDNAEPLPIGQGKLVREGSDGLVVAIGSRVMPAVAAADALAVRTGKQVAVFNARFIKPLPLVQLLELAKTHKRWLTVEENVLEGGFGSAVIEALSDAGALSGLTVKRLGLPDGFVEHGSQKALRALCGIDQPGIEAALAALLAS